MKLATRENFYRAFFHNTLDGLGYCQMIFNAQGQPINFIYIEANKKFEDLLGLKNVAGKTVTELMPDIVESNPEWLEVCGRVVLTKKPKRFETHLKHLAKWFSVSVYSSKKATFFIMLQNISDKKRSEKELKNAGIAAQNVFYDLDIEKSKVERARAKEEAILLSIGEGLIATNEKGDIIIVNKTAEKLLDLNNDEILGMNFFRAVSIEDEKGKPLALEKCPIHLALTTGAVTRTITSNPSYYYVRKNKTRFPVALVVTPVILDGRVIGAIEVFRDITQEKEIDLVKTEFVSLSSHQLRTPLTVIKWYTEMILNGDVGTVAPAQKKYLEEVLKGNQRMVDLVNMFLNVSRLELGTFTVQAEPTDIIKLTQSAVKEQKLQVKAKNLKLSEKYAKNLPLINVDPQLFRMVLQNFLSNAIKYTSNKGVLSISVNKNKDSLQIAVADTGCGIPTRQQDKIFSKLFRADNARGTDTEGVGLGLYIVKSIIDHTGGKIWFDSTENKGTTFYVRFPLSGMKNKEGPKTLV